MLTYEQACKDLEDYSKKIWALEAEVERLLTEIEHEKAQTKIVLDSYADENQRFHDEIERLTAENKQLGDHWNDISYERNALLKADERLRAALEWYAEGGNNWDRGKRARAALTDQGKE